MVKRLTVIFVVCLFVLGIFAIGAFAIDNKAKLQIKKHAILPETEVGSPEAVDMYRYLSGKYVGCEDITPEVGVIRQHVIVGTTWRDYQSNGTIGRRMGVMYQNAFRHFTWCYVDEPPATDRYVDANCYDPWTPFWTGPTPIDGGEKGSAYSYIQLMDYNPTDLTRKEIPGVTYHNYAGDPCWHTALSIDDGECEGFWSFHWDVPDWVDGQTGGGIWPSCKVVHVPITENTGRDYFHIVVNDVTTPLYILGWVRSYLDQTTPAAQLISETYHGGHKTYTTPENTPNAGPMAQPIAVVDTIGFIDAVVETSPVSKRVAIVYTSAVGDDHAGEEFGCDVGYVESMNNGDDWLSGTPFVFYNCTNYPAEGTGTVERAFIDLGACYDYEDSLHIAYITTYVDIPAGGSYYPAEAWAYHWSKKTGSSTIQHWDALENIHHQNEPCISKISISAKDPIYHPDEGVYLFSTWTQVDTADVSAAGFGNRDVFACASTDGGNSWAKVWNLTNTQTDECEAGECVSESWPSLAQNMYNGDLHIQYICDRDAGPCVWDEGVWTDNDVYYLDLEEWPIGANSKIDYRIRKPPEPPNWNRPPLKVPAEDEEVFLWVKNIGNATLVYSVTCTDPCIVAPGPQPALAPGDTALLSITVKGSGGCENSFVDADIKITTNEPDEYHLPLQAVVDVEDYYECPRDPETFDTLDNTNGETQAGLKLYVNANCQEWFHYYDPVFDTTHEVGFQGGIIVATIVDGDTLVGRCMGDNDHKSDAQDILHVNQCDVDYEPDFWIVYTKDIFINDLDPPMNDKWFCWVFSKQVKFFKPTAPPEYRNIVIKHIRVKRQGPPGWWPGGTEDCTDYGNTYIGMAMDIDCPYDSMGNQSGRNLGDFDDTDHIAYQIGWDVSGDHPQYNNFYCGIALAKETDDTTAVLVQAPFGAYNVRNDSFLYPQSPWGWLDQELYELAATPDYNVQDKDTNAFYGLDRTQVFTALEIPAGSDPNAEYSFTLVEAVAPGGEQEMKDLVALGRLIVARERKVAGIPALCGDANGDYVVDLGDVLYLIAYLYKGGAEPKCPIDRADVTSDGVVDLGDVLFIIAYLYKGGVEPKCPGIWFF